jgi:signal peptidase I
VNAREAARRALTRVVRGRGGSGTPWGEAILAEFDHTTGTWQALRWAAGGIRVVWRERRRERAAVHGVAAGRAVAIGGIVALVAALVTNQFLLTVRYVASEAMAPTLRVGDRVVVDQVGFRLTALHRGDLVMFRLPATETQAIKRVVGLPGDRISCRDGRLYRDGGAVDERYVASGSTECAPVTVPAGTLYVLGDDRSVSLDSRQLGPIPRGDVTGRVLTTFGVR